MGLGVATAGGGGGGGGGGELSAEPLVLPVRDTLSTSEEMEDGREVVRTEELRRIALPTRAVHRRLGVGLLIAGGKKERAVGWESPGRPIIYQMPGGCVEASRGPDTTKDYAHRMQLTILLFPAPNTNIQ
jgi:hypothetical protein